MSRQAGQTAREKHKRWRRQQSPNKQTSRRLPVTYAGNGCHKPTGDSTIWERQAIANMVAILLQCQNSLIGTNVLPLAMATVALAVDAAFLS